MKYIALLLTAAALSTGITYGDSHDADRPKPPRVVLPKPAPARLEGTVLTPDGLAVWEPENHGGIHVHGVSEDGRVKFDVASDPTMGGLYRIRELPAGIYDLSIRTGYVNGIPYCPQEIFGVELKPNVRTVLNVLMDQGETLSIKGKPVYPTPTAARCAEEAKAKADPVLLRQSTSAPGPTAK